MNDLLGLPMIYVIIACWQLGNRYMDSKNIQKVMELKTVEKLSSVIRQQQEEIKALEYRIATLLGDKP
jgi:cytochrome oxidase assembly protein ShyY1